MSEIASLNSNNSESIFLSNLMNSNFSDNWNLIVEDTIQTSKGKNNDQGENNNQISLSYLKEEKKINKKRNRSHKNSKYRRDNIKRKIQVYYLKFLVIFINFIIKNVIGDEYVPEKMTFSEFNYEFKKNITKKNLEVLNIESIVNMLTNDDNISYIKDNGINNKLVYNLIIIKNKNFVYLLDESCYKFFPLFYHNIKEFDLNKYKINKIIDLSSIEYFYDNLKGKLNKEYFNEKDYLDKIDEIIKKDFLKIKEKKKLFDIIEYY